VKVGDWVVLGTAEGDVRRINVRATEIQLGDRSTLIVPNSEFITKTVRNMTLANAEGRVLIRLPMPLTTDAQRVRELILAACKRARRCAGNAGAVAHARRHRERAADLPGHRLRAEPRLAGGVRSDLLFVILDELKKAALPLAVPTMVMAASAPEPLATPVVPSSPASPIPGMPG
jgi:potassium efflux system protein